MHRVRDKKKNKSKSVFLYKNRNSVLKTILYASSELSKTNYLLNNIISLFIYIAAFFITHYLRRGTFILNHDYANLLGYLSFSLLAGSFFSNKFLLTIHHELGQTLRKLTISLIFSVAFLSILLLWFKIAGISRVLVILAILSGFITESLYYYIISEKRKKIHDVEQVQTTITYFLIDFLILSIFIYSDIILKIGPYNLNETYYIMVLAIYISWMFSGSTTHKFKPSHIAADKWHATGSHLKFYTLIVALTFASAFLLNINNPALQNFIIAVLKYSIVSGILAFFLFAERIRNRTDEATTLFLKAYELNENNIEIIKRNGDSKYGFLESNGHESVVRYKLQHEFLKDYPEVFTFIERKLELKSFNVLKSLIIRSSDIFSIKVLPQDSHQLILNLHIINDQVRINNYLREINQKLILGGVFVGALLPNSSRYKKYLRKYPYFIANIVYMFDFIWKRAFPKLPVAKKIYAIFTKGRNRAISLAEGLGRLVYCGFEILDLTQIDDLIYFAAKKVSSASQEKNPYYSPIFKMRRVGKGGSTIFVYKLRTMHPYSELIQNFVYINNKIQEGGKFKNDFRIPSWGKFLRSIWIDELPMLYNWLKGDLKFVGVRPLSRHYLSLYSLEHQEKRKKYKPGLVPPYYADMPKTVEQIEHSEKIYFDAYEKNPFKTDFKYFIKAMSNILFQEKRSG